MNPIGCIDKANGKYVKGWAFDKDAGINPVVVHIYVDGICIGYAIANLPRPDLTLHVGSPNHGFRYDFSGLADGDHIVNVYAINFPYGANPQLTNSPKTITSGGTTDPIGYVDKCTPNYVKGWAFDEDAGEKPVVVHTYVDGKVVGYAIADLSRPDLVPHVGSPNHGFRYDFSGLTEGDHTVGVYAINFPPGSNPQMANSPKTITVDATKKLFQFFGKQKFLKMVSYFDAIRANQAGNLINDLDYIKSKGIDGIRIMINFDYYNYYPVDNDHTNLFNSDGSLNTYKLAHFHNVLERARERELVSDISFISAPGGINEWDLRDGIIDLIRKVKEWGYEEIIWDLANEHHNISERITTQLAQDMRNICGDTYYYGISVANGQSPETACSIEIQREGCNMLRYHDPRGSGWSSKTTDLAQRAQACAGNRPVYLDEPSRNDWGGQNYPASDFINACINARDAGIAAWCLHTDAGFESHNDGFQSRLDSVEREVMEKIGAI